MNETIATAIGQADAQEVQRRMGLGGEDPQAIIRAFIRHRATTFLREDALDEILDTPVKSSSLGARTIQPISKILVALRQDGAQPEDVRAWIRWAIGSGKDGFCHGLLGAFKEPATPQLLRDLETFFTRALMETIRFDQDLFGRIPNMRPGQRRLINMLIQRSEIYSQKALDAEAYRVQIARCRQLIMAFTT